MLTALGYDVLGVTVGGPAPLGHVQLRLDPGVTVLYGKNGSGKTRLLHALAEAFGAELREGGGHHEVLVRIGRDALESEEHESRWLSDADRALRDALSSTAQARYRDGRDPDAADIIGYPPVTLGGLIGALTDVWFWNEDPALSKRVRTDGLIVSSSTRSRDLVCGPAVTLGALVDTNEDLHLWDSIAYFDHFIAQGLGLEESVRWEPPTLDFAALATDRLLDPRVHVDVQRGEIAARSHRADWNAHPMGPWGSLTEPPVRLAGWLTQSATIRSRTLEALRRNTKRLVDAVMDDDVVLTDEAAHAVTELVAKANVLLRLTLLDAPILRLELGTPDGWMDASAPRWEAHDEPSNKWIGIDDLSTAQHRWATLAIELALMELEPDRPVVVLLDEPEAALHRTAEAHLVTGLKQLALELGGAAVVVATHSPAFLADPGVRPIHVRRSLMGFVTTAELDVPLQGDADQELAMSQLGLCRADALQLARVAVVVEGAHDEAVLTEVGATTLADTRALVLRMHGAKNVISVLDARLLIDMTDARILVVLDNDPKRRLGPKWQDLRSAAEAGDVDRVRLLVASIRNDGSAEAAWLAELAERAAATGRLDRVAVFGLRKPDILDYLDPAAFRLGESWADLQRAWRSEGRGRPAFKSWLRSERGAAISTQRVRRAAGALTTVPDDLDDLLSEIRRLAWSPTDL